MSSQKEIDEMKILFSKKVKNWEVYSVLNNNSSKYYFETPYMFLPFGVEKNYSDHILKLQFNGVKNNSNIEMINFYNLIKYFENKIILTKCIPENKLKTNIIIKNGYDDLLLLYIKKKFYNIEIFNHKGEIKNIFDIKNKSKVKCFFHSENLWYDGNIYTNKFYIDKIIIYEDE